MTRRTLWLLLLLGATALLAQKFLVSPGGNGPEQLPARSKVPAASKHPRSDAPRFERLMFAESPAREPGLTVLSPPSARADNQRKAYTEILATRSFDVLVVPVQGDGATADRNNRALIGADFTYALQQADVSTPDPFLVARALGDGLRTYRDDVVLSLASRLAVRRLIEPHIEIDPRSSTFRFRIVLTDLDHTAGSPLPSRGAARTLEWMLDYSDTSPPVLAVNSLIDEIIAACGYQSNADEIPPQTHPALADRLPASPADLLGHGPQENPLLAAAWFQLLGMLAGAGVGDEDAAAIFHQQSLVTLLRAPRQHDSSDTLLARALFQLEMRPAAIAILGNAKSPAAQALRAALDGNLPELEQAAERLPPGFQQLAAALDAAALARVYEHRVSAISTDAWARFARSHPDWEVLVARRLGALDPWYQPDDLALKHLVERLFPLDDMRLETAIAGKMVTGKLEFPDSLLAVLTRQHIDALFMRTPAHWHPAADERRPGRLELLLLIESIARANVEQNIARLLNQQALPEQAIAQLTELEPVYPGDPALAVLRAMAHFALAEDVEATQREHHLQNAFDAAQVAYYWGHGQSSTTFEAFHIMSRIAGTRNQILVDRYAQDFPGRWYWLGDMKPVAQLAYVSNRFDLALEALAAASPAEKADVEHDIARRFHGSPQAVRWKADQLLEAGDTDGARATYRSLIDARPDDWNAYQALGDILIGSRQWREAEALFLSFPGFKSGNAGFNPVRISNHAADSASRFFVRGRVQEATRLYRIAAGLGTGSAAEMLAKARLHLLDGEYADAAMTFLARGQRYEKYESYATYIELLHALGEHAEGDAAFSELRKYSQSADLYVAAMTGARMRGTTEDAFRAWMDEQRAAMPAGAYPLALMTHGLIWYLVDREPPDDFDAFIAHVEGVPRARVDARGHLVPSPGMSIQDQVALGYVGRTSLPDIDDLRIEPGDARHPYFYFASAYRESRAGRHASALEMFRLLAARTSLEFGKNTFLLPYLAFAYAKAAPDVSIERALERAAPNAPFDAHLALALGHGLRGDTHRSVAELERAFDALHQTTSQPAIAAYQWTQVCEWLYRETGTEAFRDLALDWAMKYQRIAPMHAWAYAAVARLGTSQEARMHALAMTLYLDPESAVVESATPEQHAKAKDWLSHHNPFRTERALPRTAAR